MSSFPPPVPKPASAGAGKTGLSQTSAAWVNIRNGPGTNYRDIGDLKNNTLVVFYPATLQSDGWMWIEQGGTGGWVLTYVISFKEVTAPSPPPPGRGTPFDGKLGIWHWKGDSVTENSIDDLARNLKAAAPGINQVWVKTSDITASAGAQWQGYWDTKRALAIDGPASIDRWVTALGRQNLEFVAWAIPRGINVVAEADLIVQACQRPGVKAMILDVEPYDGFWVGGREAIRPLMTRIRRALPGAFHIGICVDPRRTWYDKIYPAEWTPFVNSVHPMVYWATFRRQPDDALNETYQVWGPYGKPIVPILQGDGEATDITTAATLAVNQHGAHGLSFWRLGVMTSAQLRAASGALGNRPTDPVPPPTVEYGETQVVRPIDSGFASFSFTGRQELSDFDGTWGWKVYYKTTETQTSKVQATWRPLLKTNGKYEIAAFVPARHATSQAARYKIQGVKGTTSEVLVTLDQNQHSNEWVTLGVFDFDKATVNAGVIVLNDMTGETGKEIAFDAMRWRVVLDTPIGGGTTPFAGDGYDAPIGTADERGGTKMWPGTWLDASPYAKLYFVGTPSEAYHTGADLNLPNDADRGKPLYAAASGVVTYAAALPTWGNVIVIKHDPLVTNGQVMYSRYAHMASMAVRVGDRVTRGQQIGIIGNAFGRFAYHLHFDLSPTTILENNPGHWPGQNLPNLLANYVDPRDYVMNNRPRR